MPLCAQSPEALVPADLEVAHIPYERGGAFPGVFVSTAAARLLRPVAQLPRGGRELIGSLEQTYLSIRWGFGMKRGWRSIRVGMTSGSLFCAHSYSCRAAEQLSCLAERAHLPTWQGLWSKGVHKSG